MDEHEITIRAIQNVRIGDVELGLVVAIDDKPIAIFGLKTDADLFVQSLIQCGYVDAHSRRAKGIYEAGYRKP